MSNYTIPGPGDQCVCGSYYACRCLPEPDLDQHWEDSYQAGYEACEADGYSERPGNEWVYPIYHRARWCTDERRLVYTMTTLRFADFTWRHHHRSAYAFGRWFERQYGYDLDGYLAGYDDAGAGLPSAVRAPERHGACVDALDAYEPEPDVYDWPIGPVPAPTEVEDWLPF